MSSFQNYLSIIIPCFNEDQIIEHTIKRVSRWCDNLELKYEILIINNCSTDNTENIVQKLTTSNIFLFNENQKGKGYAVRKGLQKCSYNNALIIDADLSADIDHFDTNWLNDYKKLILGSRPLGKEYQTPLIRTVYGKSLNLIIRSLFSVDFRDTQCGFKFLSSQNIKEVAEKIEFGGFIYDLNLILICKNYSYRIEEVPVEYIFNPNSSISLIRDPFYMLLDLIKLKRKFKN